MSKRESLPKELSNERVADKKARALKLLSALERNYPDARCALDYETPFQLLVATILSAQCTDARVNLTTPALFAAYPSAETLAIAPLEHVEELVKSTGFYRQKAKNIRATALKITNNYNGEVPYEIEKLIKLAGVARKTANVVISNCFPEHAQGIAVDTHVQRIARRLRLTKVWETDKIEQELMRVLPREHWNDLTHLFIDHGRAFCKAPTPNCFSCPADISNLCPSRNKWV